MNENEITDQVSESPTTHLEIAAAQHSVVALNEGVSQESKDMFLRITGRQHGYLFT